VRLGTCIALELACCVAAVGGVWVGVGHAVELADDYVITREASASTETPYGVIARLPAGYLHVEPPQPLPTVFDATDEALLAPLGAAAVTRVKPNKGGTSLSLRLDFANGARAAFKPQQIHLQSEPRREIAAYRIDRLLGIGHVAPAKPAKFTLTELVAAADPQLRGVTTQRLVGETRSKDGVVRGFIAWWIPEIRDARIGIHNVDSAEGMDLWTSYLRIGAKVPEVSRSLVEQLASLVVFDVVIDNADRWSGSNVKVSPDRKTLYFMDNTLSFSLFTKGHDNNLRPMYRMQVFPRGLIMRLRALSLESLAAVLDLADDAAGIGPLLTPPELAAVMTRRDHVLAYVDRLIAQFGEDAVLALP
jgi:Golgi casein kinase, C-terminal, Fam20